MIQIWYHKNCNDGFAAAYIAYKKQLELIEKKLIRLVALNYGDEVPSYTSDDIIYIVDFSLPEATCEQILSRVKELVVIDHHETSKWLKGKSYAYFDQEHSGAWLAWRYFRDVIAPVPWWVEYIQDRDLWTWHKLMSREVNAYIMTWEYEIGVWDEKLKRGLSHAMEHGHTLLEYQNKQIKLLMENVHDVFLNTPMGIVGYPAINSPIMQSELGNELAKKHGLGVVYYVKDSKVVFSLRSVGDQFNTEVIARFNGGGGHKNAAGFVKPITILSDLFPKEILV